MTNFFAHRFIVHVLRAIALMALLVLPFTPIQAATYPALQGYITDSADLLSTEERVSLEATLSSFKQGTGNEIAVVTVATLEGDAIEHYAVELFQKWGIGDKEKDNGLLILVAKEEREVRIEVGYGMEGIINDAKAGRIIREIMAPRFREEKFGVGIIEASNVLIAEISGDAAASLPPESNMPIPKNIGQIMPVLFLFLMYLSSYLARSKRWWPGGVVGAVGGGAVGALFGSWIVGGIGLGLLGLFFDYLLSKNYQSRAARGLPTTWWGSGGGFRGGGFGGGFGGFGGGMSGGGGASGRW